MCTAQLVIIPDVIMENSIYFVLNCGTLTQKRRKFKLNFDNNEVMNNFVLRPMNALTLETAVDNAFATTATFEIFRGFPKRSAR